MALRKLRSDSPTYLSYRRPTSSLSRGRDQSRAITFAASDLPQPCTPTSSTPLGAGRLSSTASGRAAVRARSSHLRRLSKPPSSYTLSATGKYSSGLSSRSAFALRSTTRATSSRVRRPSSMATWATAWRAWLRVSPLRATASSSRSAGWSSTVALRWASSDSTTVEIVRRYSSRVGIASSQVTDAASISGGSSRLAPVSTTVERRPGAEKRSSRSRKARDAWGAARCGAKSCRTNRLSAVSSPMAASA